MLTTLFHRFALWPLLLISHFLVASLLAWHLLAQVDFGFSWAYPLLNIDEHIEEFGPRNRYKSGFAETDRAQHQRLFGEISRAIQNGGEGLADIEYVRADGTRIRLMREPEVVHLQDVARLVSFYYAAGLVAAALLVGLVAYARRFRRRPPTARKVLAITGGVLAAGAALLWLIGPETVFYWLHEAIFPEDHPWFFYYQDSLMTTLMKAPDLFGFIGALLLALTLILWALSGLPLWRWLSRARA